VVSRVWRVGTISPTPLLLVIPASVGTTLYPLLPTPYSLPPLITNNEQPITNYLSRDAPFSDILKDGIVKLS
jgi:hypothetical protein